MASLLQKLAKKPCLKKLSLLLRSSTAPLLNHHQSHIINPLPNSPLLKNQIEKEPNGFPHIYPSFPFGLPQNPILGCGAVLTEPKDDLEFDESNIIWADSVKKKRKKKMNKHKLKKLRKRLRRKSKS